MAKKIATERLEGTQAYFLTPGDVFEANGARHITVKVARIPNIPGMVYIITEVEGVVIQAGETQIFDRVLPIVAASPEAALAEVEAPSAETPQA